MRGVLIYWKRARGPGDGEFPSGQLERGSGTESEVEQSVGSQFYPAMNFQRALPHPDLRGVINDGETLHIGVIGHEDLVSDEKGKVQQMLISALEAIYRKTRAGMIVLHVPEDGLAGEWTLEAFKAFAEQQTGLSTATKEAAQVDRENGYVRW